MNIEFIKDLARKYANVCEFKSDFPHDWNSVEDGYVEGFKTAERLVNENLIIHFISKRSELLIGLLEMLEKEGGNEFINKAELVAKYEANLQ